MAKPVSKNLEIYMGDFFEVYFRIRTRVWDPLANGGEGGYVPGPYRDLTGYTGLAQVRKTRDAAAPMGSFTVDLDDQTQPETVGGLWVRMEAAVTALLEPTIDPRVKWVWDLQLTDTNGKPITRATGSVSVTQDVSRV